MRRVFELLPDPNRVVFGNQLSRFVAKLFYCALSPCIQALLGLIHLLLGRLLLVFLCVPIRRLRLIEGLLERINLTFEGVFHVGLLDGQLVIHVFGVAIACFLGKDPNISRPHLEVIREPFLDEHAGLLLEVLPEPLLRGILGSL